MVRKIRAVIKSFTVTFEEWADVTRETVEAYAENVLNAKLINYSIIRFEPDTEAMAYDFMRVEMNVTDSDYEMAQVKHYRQCVAVRKAEAV